MGDRTVPSQFDQVLPRFAVQEAASDPRDGRVRFRTFGKGGRGLSKSRGILPTDIKYLPKPKQPKLAIQAAKEGFGRKIGQNVKLRARP